MLFRYVALDSGGREVKGELEAPDQKTAAALLRKQGLLVAELTRRGGRPGTAVGGTAPAEGEGSDLLRRLRTAFGRLWPIRDRDRITFLRQGALMLRSGLTLLQCLEEAGRATPKVRFAEALGRVSGAIQSGMSFSAAMAGEGRTFPLIVVKLVESAEASGEMDTVLDQLADHLEKKAQLRTNLLSSLLYPAIVVLVTVGVCAFLILKVIPKFVKFFASKNAALPWSTQFLMDLSGFLTRYGLPMLAASGLAVGALVFLYHTPGGRQLIDRGLLMLPLVGKLLTTAAMAHTGRTLAILLRSGVTILESLKIVRGIVSNRAIAACIEAASEQILGGKDLAGSLRHPVIPSLVPQVVGVGERTGALVHVLEELGQYYERQLQSITKTMSLLIEPVLILVIGVIVGFVYFAFFQAMFQLATAGR